LVVLSVSVLHGLGGKAQGAIVATVDQSDIRGLVTDMT
jgi:hypothetical protein